MLSSLSIKRKRTYGAEKVGATPQSDGLIQFRLTLQYTTKSRVVPENVMKYRIFVMKYNFWGGTRWKNNKEGSAAPLDTGLKKILTCFWYGIHDDRKRRCRINRLHFRLKSAGFTAEPERNVLSGCWFFMQIHEFSAALRLSNKRTGLFYNAFSHEFLLSWHSTTVLFR